jgi:FkbM family methyltransferase
MELWQRGLYPKSVSSVVGCRREDPVTKLNFIWIIFVYYAQHGEDLWLERHWHRLGLPTDGIFVEVGVGNGRDMSNTLWLENRGWDGLLIEPDPRLHDIIRANRRARLVPYAIGHKPAPFCLMDDASLSGFRRTEGEMINVTTKGLTEVLLECHYTCVDILSIDTEGTEVEVWETFDYAKFRPKVVFAEWNTVGLPDKSEEIIASIGRDGYKAECFLGGNIVFVRTD